MLLLCSFWVQIYTSTGGGGGGFGWEESLKLSQPSLSKGIMVGRDMTKKTSAVQGCGISKYVRSKEARVFRIRDSQLNEAGRDFNIRYCDQKTRGGGWTVKNNQNQFDF